MTHHRTPVKKKIHKSSAKKREAQQHVLPRFASSTTPRNNTQWWENTQTISCVRQKTKQNRRKTKKCVSLWTKTCRFFCHPLLGVCPRHSFGFQAGAVGRTGRKRRERGSHRGVSQPSPRLTGAACAKHNTWRLRKPKYPHLPPHSASRRTTQVLAEISTPVVVSRDTDGNEQPIEEGWLLLGEYGTGPPVGSFSKTKARMQETRP